MITDAVNDQFERDIDEALHREWPCYHESDGPQTFSCELDTTDSSYVLGAMEERGLTDREAFTREALINHSHA